MYKKPFTPKQAGLLRTTVRPESGKQKIEGFDVTGQGFLKTKENKKLNQSIDQQINDIKNAKEINKQQNRNLKGLQQEVKTLDYELNVLKEKENLYKDELNQMNTFFSDGVPFNNNIISLKGQYLKKIEDNKSLNSKMENLIKNIQKDNSELEADIQDQIEQITCDSNRALQKEQDQQEKIVELQQSIFDLQSKLTFEENKNENLNQEFKHIKEQILIMERDFEKNKLTVPKQEQNNLQSLFNLQKILQDKTLLSQTLKNQQEDLQDKINEDFFVKETNREVNKVLEEEMILNKKLLSTEQKIKELDIIIQLQKRDYKAEEKELQILEEIVDELKKIIDFQQQDQSNQVYQKLKKMQQEIKNGLKKELDLKEIRIRQLQDQKRLYEEELENKVNIKIQWQQEIIANDQQILMLQEQFSKDEEKYIETEKDKIWLDNTIEQLLSKIIQYQQEIDSFREQIPSLQNQNEVLEKELQDLKEQYSIGLEIKRLFIQEATISANSNHSLSETLNRFIGQIQRHTKEQ